MKSLRHFLFSVRIPVRALLLVPFAYLFLFCGRAAFAQTPTVPLDPVIQALTGHAYAVAAALVVGWVVSLTKTGWLSTWLAQKLPSRFLPLWAFGIGELGTVTASVIAGTDWKVALLQGLESSAIAVFTHQVVIEGFRKGAEVSKPTPKLVATRIAAKLVIPPPAPPSVP